MRKKILYFVVSAAIFLAAFYGVRKIAPLLLSKFEPSSGLREASRAPDFNLTDVRGQSFRLSDFKNRAAILYFWTSWNPISKDYLKILDEYHRSLEGKENVAVLAINSQEGEETVKKIKDEENLEMTLLLDKEGEVGELYGIGVLPMTIFVSRGGLRVGEIIGPFEISHIREKLEM